MSTLADIEFASQALVTALSEADAMAKAGVLGDELVEVVRHAREVAEVLQEHITGAGDAVTPDVRSMAATLAAAVQSLEQQIPGHGSMH